MILKCLSPYGTMTPMATNRQTPDLSLVKQAKAALDAEEKAHKQRMQELRLELGLAIRETRLTKRALQDDIAEYLGRKRDAVRLLQRDAEKAAGLPPGK